MKKSSRTLGLTKKTITKLNALTEDQLRGGSSSGIVCAPYTEGLFCNSIDCATGALWC